MDYMSIISKILASGKNKMDDLEVYLVAKKSLEIGIFKGEIDKYAISESGGISLRGTKDKKIGYAYTEKIDENIIDSLIEEVYENGKYIETQENDEIFEGSTDYQDIYKYDDRLNQISIDEKIEICKKLEDYAYSLDNRINTVQSCHYKEIEREKVIKNTKGIELKDKQNLAYLYVSVIVNDGEDTKTGSSYEVFTDLASVDYKKIVEEAVENAISMIGAEPIKSGAYPVIIKNTTFANFLDAYSSVFSADLAQKGLSLLKDRVGEKIGTRKLTLIDDPLYEEGFSSGSFDDEGTRTQYKKVIDKGVLKTLLHSWKTAKKEGRESTGNASRPSYKSSVSISPSNFYIESGEKGFDEMIADVDYGVYITDLTGLHSGINPVSGDFSLSAFGHEILKGQISKPINQITIAGNFFDLLKDIEDVGNDLKFGLPGKGYFGSPSIKIKSLSIAGK